MEALFGGHDLDVIVLDLTSGRPTCTLSVRRRRRCASAEAGRRGLGKAVDLQPDPSPRSPLARGPQPRGGHRGGRRQTLFQDYRVDSCMVINSRDNRGREAVEDHCVTCTSAPWARQEAMLAIGGHGVDFGGARRWT